MTTMISDCKFSSFFQFNDGFPMCRSRFLAAFVAALLACSIFVPMFGYAQEEESSDEPAPRYEPTSHYEAREIEGWQVMIQKRLLVEEHAEGAQAIRLVQRQLQQIKDLVSDDIVKDLQQISIWMDDDPRNQIHYHPQRSWLVANGFNPDRAKAVDIGRVDQLIRIQHAQPFVLLHELSHAYHDQVLGFDDERVRKAYEEAKEAGTYEQVLHTSGRMVKHYALTDHKEYFAECTEAFLGTNDYFPFVAAELKRHDPGMYQLLTEIWGSR